MREQVLLSPSVHEQAGVTGPVLQSWLAAVLLGASLPGGGMVGILSDQVALA